MYDFIWNGKKDKVKRLTLINPIESGGLAMPHLDSMINAQRVMCVVKMLSQYKSG